MAFGKRRGGDFQPLCKWDGRTGRLYTEDRDQSGQKVQNDITDNFCAALDLKNMKQAWLLLVSGRAPEMKLFPMEVEDIGPPPGEGWREGIRLEVKLEGEDFWRECLSTAIGLWNGLDELHDDFVELARENPDMVPLVQLDEVRQIPGKNGMSHEPVFSIVDWIDRDDVPPPRPIPKTKPAVAEPKKKKPARDDLDDEIGF
jgi:hypothetical protein